MTPIIQWTKIEDIKRDIMGDVLGRSSKGQLLIGELEYNHFGRFYQVRKLHQVIENVTHYIKVSDLTKILP